MGMKRRPAWLIVLAMLTQLGLVGCTGDGAAELVAESRRTSEPGERSPTTESVTLTWYTVPAGIGPAAGEQPGVDQCVADSDGRYEIETVQLPVNIDDQFARLKTMFAADEAMDLVSLDTTVLAEFTAAGYLRSLPGSDQGRLRDTMLAGPLRSQTVDGQVMGFPQFSNTQLLWYRKSVARRGGLDLSRPVTWDELISAAESARTTVQAQALEYEGYVVWLNALIEGAGGDLLEPDSNSGRAATEVIHRLSTSDAADPALEHTHEGQTHIRFFNGDAGYMVNWPYVWTKKVRTSALWNLNDLGWAMYPRTTSDRQARPPVAGVTLAVAAASNHPQLAVAAARCLTSRRQQATLMLTQGLISGIASVYDDPRIRRAYPMADLLRRSLQAGAPRPVTANYREVSAALQEVYWPPDLVDPRTTPHEAQRAVDAVLQ